jgi:hypothetical protein
MALDPERYVVGDDGLLVEKVGPWAKDKLEIVGDYIQISGATRRKYRENRPAFIDVFCGPGRSLVRSTGEYIDGSPVTAFKQGKHSAERFATIEAPISNRSYLPQRRHACRSWGRRYAPPPALRSRRSRTSFRRSSSTVCISRCSTRTISAPYRSPSLSNWRS